MGKKIEHLRETRRLLREAVRQLADRDERQLVLIQTAHYLERQEQLQRMPLVARLRHYRLAYYVYDYLRRNGQLGRRVGSFDRHVKEAIEGVLSEMMYENGTEGDF